MWQDRKPFTPATLPLQPSLTYSPLPPLPLQTLTYNPPAFAFVQFVNRFGWKSQSMHASSQLIVIDINQSDFNWKSYCSSKNFIGCFSSKGGWSQMVLFPRRDNVVSVRALSSQETLMSFFIDHPGHKKTRFLSLVWRNADFLFLKSQ